MDGALFSCTIYFSHIRAMRGWQWKALCNGLACQRLTHWATEFPTVIREALHVFISLAEQKSVVKSRRNGWWVRAYIFELGCGCIQPRFTTFRWVTVRRAIKPQATHWSIGNEVFSTCTYNLIDLHLWQSDWNGHKYYLTFHTLWFTCRHDAWTMPRL